MWARIHNLKYSIKMQEYTDEMKTHPVVVYLFKVNNKNTRTMFEICSKLTIKTLEWRQWRHYVLLLTFSKQMPAAG